MNNDYDLVRSVAELEQLEPMQVLIGEHTEKQEAIKAELVAMTDIRSQMNKQLTGEQILIKMAHLQGQLEGLQQLTNRLTYYKKLTKQNHE